MSISATRLRAALIATFVLAIAATAAVVIDLAPALGNGPTSFSGTSSGAIVSVTNSGTGQAVLGTVSAAGATAIRGNATSTSTTKSYGVIGSSKNGYGVWALTSAKGWPALFALNSALTGGTAIRGQSVGNAVVGISGKANGVVGQTEMGVAATGQAGVLGQDLSTSGFTNSGVTGISTNGNGISGQSTNGPGVSGTSANNPGVSGTSTGTNWPGVSAFSAKGDGVDATSDAPGGAAVNAIDSTGTGVRAQTSGGTGVVAGATTGWGLQAFSTSNYGALVQSGSGIALYARNNNDTQPAAVVNGGSNLGSATTGDPVMIVHYNGMGLKCNGVSSSTGDLMSIDQVGNMVLCGVLTTKTFPLVAHRSLTGQAVGTYGAQQSVPTIEDIGQAQLVGGQAYVRIDPAFAAMMDPRSSYLVFITPDGDSRGLYTMQKSIQGFWVRENQSGHSNVAFDYRIVAKPVYSSAQRLPLIRSVRFHRSADPALPRLVPIKPRLPLVAVKPSN